MLYNSLRFEQTVVIEAIVVFVGDDEVIEQWYFEYFAGGGDAVGDADVAVGRFELAGGVVVGDDDAGCVVCDGVFKYQLGIHKGARSAAHGDALEVCDAVGAIEQEDEELFVVEILEVVSDGLEGIAGRANFGFLWCGFDHATSADFESGSDGDGFGFADAGEAAEVFDIESAEV